jgi:hypothetical protein
VVGEIVSGFHTHTQNHGLFQALTLFFALVLTCQSVWILGAEIWRPSFSSFPDTPQSAATYAREQNAADLAASIGLVRGDLWSEYALTYVDLIWNDGQPGANYRNSETIAQAYKVIDRALSLAPHNADIWLLLAGIDLQDDWINQKAAGAALRMSYYTGANNSEIIPLRLRLAVRSEALANDDFKELVRHDINFVITRAPALKYTIVTAYQKALPAGQQFLKETLKTLDPNLLSNLQPNG